MILEDDISDFSQGSGNIPVNTFKKVITKIKTEIENAQEDYANLDWISKEQAIKIIEKHIGKSLMPKESEVKDGT